MDADSLGTNAAASATPFQGRNWCASLSSGWGTASELSAGPGAQSCWGAIGGDVVPSDDRVIPRRTCSGARMVRNLNCWHSARMATFLVSSGEDWPAATTAMTTTCRTSYASRRWSPPQKGTVSAWSYGITGRVSTVFLEGKWKVLGLISKWCVK